MIFLTITIIDKKAGLEKQLDILLDMKLREQINNEDYNRKRANLAGQLNKIREMAKGTEYRADDWRQLAERTFEFACNAKHSFDTGSLEAKKAILQAIGSNLVVKGTENWQ